MREVLLVESAQPLCPWRKPSVKKTYRLGWLCVFDLARVFEEILLDFSLFSADL